MKHIGLFEGVGGFSLAAEMMGWETIAWCEINPFCHTVLNYHFPNATGHHDIKKTDFTIYRGKCDIITGGFPCQPYSAAGKRLGTEDDRHLWPEMLRTIREIQPPWVVGENVRGLTNWNGGLVFDQVQADLEAEGYQVTPFLLPACAVNAPHRRDRIWFIAYCESWGARRLRIESEEARASESNKSFRSIYRIPPTSYPTSEGRKEWEQERSGQGNGGYERFGGTGIAPDTDSTGLQETGTKQQTAGTSRSSTQRPSANPECQGLEGDRKPRSRGTGSSNQDSGNDADTDGIRLWEKGDRDRKPRFISQKSQRNYWTNFPTESPVCGRNDGISSRLVGITFSKHRQESIKAYGNAVVPQVVVQIFKAIDKYNNLMP